MKKLIDQDAYLLIGLIAVLIQIVSHALFEVNADSSLRIKTIILTIIEKEPITTLNTINEYKARLLWLGSSLLSIAAYVIALVWSIATVYRCCQSQDLYKIMGLGVAVGSLNLWSILTADYHSAMFNNVFSTTFEALKVSPLIGELLLGKVFVIIAIINVLAAITPVVILMAICSVITLPSANDERNLTFFVERIKRLEQGIIIGSMIMLFGIIHMTAWTQWPIAILDETVLKKSILATFVATCQYWGVAFSLLLFSLYACTLIYWRSQVRLVLRYTHPDIDASQWLQENGFNLSWQKHISQIAAMLTPMLAGLSSNGMNLLSLH